MPGREPDPDIAAAANVLRGLFTSPADVEAAMANALRTARDKGGSGGLLATALIEVMGVAHEWNLQSGATITSQDAA
ncbi:MAG TPA: hypothetical protein VGI56_11925, partial [Galbitalea sp.]